MTTIRLEAPVVEGQTATFRWTVEPATPLYRRTNFTIEFPESVDLRRVPDALWWRVALVCLHAQWTLLRPCRVVLPVRLPPGEREFWLRLLDAEVAALESGAGRTDTARTTDLIEAGPPLAALEPVPDEGLVAACFSGGRDSLTQTALLQELGERPLLVATKSPREGSVEHETARREEVMREIVRRRGVEVVEARSDLRGAWDNDFAGRRYPVGINEVTDTFLFFAVALVVAAARGARRICLASEAEVQESARVDGAIVQHKHFMYSAATQRALQALLEPAGIRYCGLTYPLLQFQVQRLLAKRYADLRDLQYSCWELSADQHACSRCNECRQIAFNLMADGVDPSEIGIDLATLLVAQADWRPGVGARRSSVVGARAHELMDAQMLRCVEAIPPERVGQLIGRNGSASAEALRAYETLRTATLNGPLDPEPGYRAGFLELLEDRWRDGLTAIYDEHFARAPEESYAGLLERTRTLARWIAAPLRQPELDRRLRVRPDDRPRALAARPPSPPPPTEEELAPVRAIIPDAEPELTAPADGRTLHVAETLLDGNELRYVTECVESNWVSSTGSFVTRFEAAFAQAAGCRYAIACSGGTTALHLAMAAGGLGPGDEVIVPAFTMIATANAVSYVGATPVFVDSDPDTWNLDLERVVDAIGPRTRAIVVMHTYGLPVDADAVRAIAEANQLLLIEDAAEAHGAECRGRRAGSLGDVAAFSFYGNKIVTTGEGGMVTTNDDEIATIARELRDHGFSPERHFWHRFRAFNYRMSNLQAAVGLAQVERLDELVGARRRNARWYREQLGAVEGLSLAPEHEGMESSDWMIGVLVEDGFGCSRDELRRHLAADGIETRTFFVPLHMQPAYLRDNPGRRHPVAERLGRTGLYLPSAPTLTEADVARVAGSIRRAQAEALSPSSA